MKTIREWFEETLPKDIADLAIQTTIELRSERILKAKEPDFQNAILGAFVWEKSPQDDDFWRTIYDSNGKIIPELPKNK